MAVKLSSVSPCSGTSPHQLPERRPKAVWSVELSVQGLVVDEKMHFLAVPPGEMVHVLVELIEESFGPVIDISLCVQNGADYL